MNSLNCQEDGTSWVRYSVLVCGRETVRVVERGDCATLRIAIISVKHDVGGVFQLVIAEERIHQAAKKTKKLVFHFWRRASNKLMRCRVACCVLFGHYRLSESAYGDKLSVPLCTGFL